MVGDVPGQSVDLVNEDDVDTLAGPRQELPEDGTISRPGRNSRLYELLKNVPVALAHGLELCGNRELLLGLFVRGDTGIGEAIHTCVVNDRRLRVYHSEPLASYALISHTASTSSPYQSTTESSLSV